MSIIGIVAEYNPFHLGHRWHIAQSRALAGGDTTVVCVMSGDFVQRGEAAVFSKYARAEAACRCGADLVVELPLPWCLSSAEGFAGGAVSLLAALGCDTLSFGSEAGGVEPLQRAAALLVDEAVDRRIGEAQKAQPDRGYAAVRERVLAEYLGEEARLLEQPNNILGVEYCKAILRGGYRLRPMTVLRRGAAHDEQGGEFPSARALRELLREGHDVAPMLPEEAAAVFYRELVHGRAVLSGERTELLLLSRLRALTAADLEKLPDADLSLARRLGRAIAEEPSLEKILAAAGTKRYPTARLRRILIRAALGVPGCARYEKPPYARVLAANARGCAHLRTLRDAELPIVMKPAVLRGIGGDALRCFERGAAAHDFWALGCPAEEARRGGADWRESPRIL